MAFAFDIDHLDHVAITAMDMERSAAWYQKALGLQRYDIPEWGGAPIFLLAGQTGIALFPAKAENRANAPAVAEPTVRIDHFAFHVSRENFEKAKIHYDSLGLSYTVKDHIHYHSIYTRDPDGHTVELTTLIGNQEDFFRIGQAQQ